MRYSCLSGPVVYSANMLNMFDSSVCEVIRYHLVQVRQYLKRLSSKGYPMITGGRGDSSSMSLM